MEELSKLVMLYFKNENKFHTLNEIKKKLNIKGLEQTEIFNRVIDSLIENGSLFFDDKKGYRIFTNELGFAYGKIEINKTGNGFVHTKDGYTIFINNENLNGALNGDTVIVHSITNSRNKNFEGKIKSILKRETGNIIYQVIMDENGINLKPYNNYEHIKIDINKNELRNLVDGQMVLVNVSTELKNGCYKAEIINTIGHKNDPGIDVRLIAIKYNVPIDFSKEVLEEANKLPKEVSSKDIVNRIDLREKQIFTIDCDDTKDRDDAIFVEKLENGNYKLIVSIADVSHYVKRGSKLFDEALNRCTSHYINNTCIPMFPHILSNGICSLNEGVDRLTKSCEMEINSNGDIVNYDIYDSVINSRKAMKYSEVNKVLNGEKLDKYTPFLNQLKIMNELNNILERKKEERNYLDFDISDIKLIQNDYGKPVDFKTDERGIAEKLIENFMVMTNTTVAQNYSWLPFIFRVHEYPKEEKINSIIDLLKASGVNINKCKSINEYSINNILEQIKKVDSNGIFRSYLLKAMERAKYDILNCGHFALQLPLYCHFTSPIRRVADFMIHTVISELNDFDYSKESIDNLENELNEISKSASKLEKIDFDMENEGKAMAMAEYMEDHIGDRFEGIVSEVYQHGMFVRTNNNISGKVSFENMLDDKYSFDNDRKLIIGKNTKNKYKIGDKVIVLVKDASKENRTINFQIGKQKSLSYA